jgi:hypothetical protein
MKHRNPEELAHDLHERQRNIVFPDTARNFGGLWAGLYRQKLNRAQTVGFIVLILFYLVFIVGLVLENSEDLRSGYWVYLLLCLPLVGFFFFMRWRLRREEQPAPKGRSSP